MSAETTDRSTGLAGRGDGLAETGDRGMIGVVSGLIAREISPHMLDVKTSLVARIEPFDQLFEGGFPGDDHELVASRHEVTHSWPEDEDALHAAVEEGREDLGRDGQVADPAGVLAQLGYGQGEHLLGSIAV